MKWQVNDAAILDVHYFGYKNAGPTKVLRVVGLTDEGVPFVRHSSEIIVDNGDFIRAGKFKRTWWGGWKFIPNDGV